MSDVSHGFRRFVSSVTAWRRRGKNSRAARVAVSLALPIALAVTLGVILAVSAATPTRIGQSALEAAAMASGNAGYTVTYEGNGATGGTAPVDGSSPYRPGATVTVLGNSGAGHDGQHLRRLGHPVRRHRHQLRRGRHLYDLGEHRAVPGLIAGEPVTYNVNGATGGTAPVDPANTSRRNRHRSRQHRQPGKAGFLRRLEHGG